MSPASMLRLRALSGCAILLGVLTLTALTPGCGLSRARGKPPLKKEDPSPQGTPATSDWMALYFKHLPPARVTPPPPLRELTGTWKGQIRSIEIEGQAGLPSPDVSALPPFLFEIRRSGESYTLSATTGRGKPRALAATSEGLVARGAGGQPDVRLMWQNGTLVGILPIERPLKGKVEFHATRSR